MRIFKGDTVFNARGKPAVVLDRNGITGELKVEGQGPTFENTRKHGFINGMSVEDRASFNKIVGDIAKIEDPTTRVREYAKHIDLLKDDPKNRFLVKYLTAEQAHLMYSENITQGTYSMWESKT
jgi:hypothetical protein